MAEIDGTIRGVTLVHAPFAGAGTVSARDAREVWLLTADFAAYTASSDTAAIEDVGATISARCRDGKTRTVEWAAPAFGGQDSTPQAVYMLGASIDALAVSTDKVTGELTDNDGTEVDTSGVTHGVGVLVSVTVS